MKKLIFILLLGLAFIACKKKENAKTEAVKQDSTEQKTSQENTKLSEAEQKDIEDQTNSIPAPPDYANLILGRWENKEDRNFWAFYDKNKVFGDGNEEGSPYKIDLGKITYGYGSEAMILDINEKEMFLQINGENETWVKADFDGLPPEQETSKIDPKKLIGLWDMEGGDEFSSKSKKVYPDFYEIFTCKNPSGITETLLATFDKDGKRGFIYKSSKNPNKEIPLTIVSNENDEVFVVNFPKSKKSYTLKTCIACPEITCNNPDGSIQTFSLDYTLWGNRGTYRCVNPDKSIEYLRIEGSGRGLSVQYSSSKNPKWITLGVSNLNMGDMDSIHFFDVQFPKENKSYRIEASGERYEYYVWLPNGGQQTFLWINK